MKKWTDRPGTLAARVRACTAHPQTERSAPRAFGRTIPAVLLLSLALFVAAGAAGVQGGPASFVMADIHGDYGSMSALLAQTGLADSQGRWTGGEATFVQTGDYTDRGPEVRRVMDYLMALERSAPDGRVRILLGNHEVMNLIGDLRDVTEADYRSFSDAGSEARRLEAMEEYLSFEARRRERLGLPASEAGPDAREEWLQAHPPGFVERRRALSPDGEYGRWLRERPVVVGQDEILFMHAGIHPALAGLSVDEINRRVRDELRTFDTYLTYLTDEGIALPFSTFPEMVAAVREELEAQRDGRIRNDPDRTEILEGFLEIGNWLSIHPEGVLWFRGFAEWTEEEGASRIGELLERYDVEHFVVGHTPQAGGRIRSRFGGRVYLADTGMLSSYYTGGQGSILRIRDGVFETLYLEAPTAERTGALTID